MKYRYLAHSTALFIILTAAYVSILSFSPAVRASIVIAISIVMITSEITKMAPSFSKRHLSLLLLLPGYFILQFGYNLSIRDTGPDTYVAIFQTFGLEAFWFARTYGEFSGYITILLLVCAIFVIVNGTFHRTLVSPLYLPLAVGLLAIVLMSFSLFPSLNAELGKLKAAHLSLQREKKIFELADPKFLRSVLAGTPSRRLSLVMVIGESTSSWNVSLYGYPRKTFAPLGQVANLIVFDDVVAPDTNTYPSLMRALTSDKFDPTARYKPSSLSHDGEPACGIHKSVTADDNFLGAASECRTATALESRSQQIITLLSKLTCALYWKQRLNCEKNIRVKEEAREITLSGHFDTLWYLNRYYDVLEAGIDPVEHYILYGAHEGRDPSPRFSTRDYLHRHPDVVASGMNPLLHYLRFEMRESRDLSLFTANSSQQSLTIPIISALNSAAIQTFWYSNQNEYGIWDNPISHFGKLAKETYFHRKTVGIDLNGKYYDEDLVKIAIDRIKTLPERSALFFHFYASHFPYCGVIPAPHNWGRDVINELPTKAIFGHYNGDKSLVDCYDSAVYYVAENIERIREWVDSHQHPVVLVYFSDHGEDVFTGVAHQSTRFTHKMSQVPLLIYFNAAARTDYPELFEALNNNRHAPINLENMFDLILDLFSIDLKGYSTEGKSIASANYKPRNRVIVDRGPRGVVSFDTGSEVNAISPNIADSYVKQRRQLNAVPADLRQRICAHRNNSLLKFMEAMSLFSCLEIDVTIRDGIAMVYHDDDKPNGLPLDTILSLKDTTAKRIWLDVKNLTDENVDVLLKVLEKYHRRYDNTLVEVGATLARSRAAQRLVEAGYQVSYYLPTELSLACLGPELGDQCREFAAKVERDLNAGFSSLSYDFAAQAFVSKLRLPKNLSISTWDLNANLGELAKRAEISKYNMFIIPFASSFDF